MVTRGGRRRRRAAIGALLAVLAAAGTVAATAAPAEAAVTGAVVREGDFINVPAFGVADGAVGRVVESVGRDGSGWFVGQ